MVFGSENASMRSARLEDHKWVAKAKGRVPESPASIFRDAWPNAPCTQHHAYGLQNNRKMHIAILVELITYSAKHKQSASLTRPGGRGMRPCPHLNVRALAAPSRFLLVS